LVVVSLHLSSRLRGTLEGELAERLRLSAHLVSGVLEDGPLADPEGKRGLSSELAQRIEEIRRATAVTDIAVYDRQGGFLGGALSGPVTGVVPRQIRLAEPPAASAPVDPDDRDPERDPAGGLTLVIPLPPGVLAGALLTRIGRESQGDLAAIDFFFQMAKALAGVVIAAGLLILLRWVARGGAEPVTRPAPITPASDVDMVLGTMKKVMTTLKDSESVYRDRWTAAEADAEHHRITNDLILESMTSGIVAFDAAGRITMFNRAAEDILGIEARPTIGRDLAHVFGPEDQLTRIGDELLRTGGGENRIECERPGSEGESRWLGIASSVIRRGDGETAGGILLLNDFTETKRLRETMALKDRLSAVGEMSAGIAHEIKNCLHSMKGYENLLQDDLNGGEPSMAVRGILSEAGSLESLVRGVLEFSRPSPLARSMTSVNTILEEMVESTQERARANRVTVELELAEDRPSAEVDDRAVRGVFRNLALNAIESMEQGGTLTIATRWAETPSERGGRAPQGRFVRISFRDTGPGIPEADRVRVFTPFYTTKREGSGLGLALAHKTVTDHGGRMHLYSRVGVGTEFVILLPEEAS
jgi:PAS domain S-box-containing protein